MAIIDTVRRIYELYGSGEIDGALALCADDMCFSWPVDNSLVRFGGSCAGREAFRARLIELHEIYDYHSFRAVSLIADGDRVAAQLELELTHRQSGRRIKMESAHFWTVRDGRAVELVEYYDTALASSVDNFTAAAAA